MPTPMPTRRSQGAVLAVLVVMGPTIGVVVGRNSVDSVPSAAAFEATAPAISVVAATAAPIDPMPTTPSAEPIPITSRDGRFQAWVDAVESSVEGYAPPGRAETTIVIRDSLDGSSRSITLARNLEPEAFSPDGSTLYTIDHRPALDPEVYRVTALDLRTEALRDVLGPWKQPVLEEMRGESRQQVWAPDGTQLYTLYVRQTHVEVGGTNPHIATSGAGEEAFVHVLDVVDGWAICLELPSGFGMGPADSTDIFVSADGATITAVDHHVGQTVEVDRLPVANGLRTGFLVGQPTIATGP